MSNYRNVTATSCERVFHCVVEHECEALNLMCLLLYHAGLLHPYSASDKPCDVLVVNPLDHLEAKFHCWYIEKTDGTGISFQTECFFVKRVCI